MPDKIRRYFVFQDESGEISEKYFFSGATVIPELEMLKFQSIIDEVRTKNNFYDEFHFQKISKKRYKAYKELLTKCLEELHFFHKTIVIARNNLDMKYFGNQDYLAYNYFTRQVIYNLIKQLSGSIYIYPDERNRIKKDNFLDYLFTQLNLDSYYNDLNYHVSSVEPRSSKENVGLQLNDLLLGIIRQIYLPAPGKYKILLKNEISCLSSFWIKCNIWKWQPKNKR